MPLITNALEKLNADLNTLGIKIDALSINVDTLVARLRERRDRGKQ